VRSLQSRNVLVVGETETFLGLGGTINLYVELDSVKFAINLAAAERANLKINAKLLRLAKPFKAERRSE